MMRFCKLPVRLEVAFLQPDRQYKDKLRIIRYKLFVLVRTATATL